MDWNFNPKLEDPTIKEILKIQKRVKSLEAKEINIIDLSFDAPKLFTPDIILEAAKEILRHSKKIQPMYSGIPELKTEICDYIDRTRGFRPKLNQIIVGPGLKSLIFSVLFTIIEKGDALLTLDPSTPLESRIAELAGARLYRLSCDPDKNFKIDLSKLGNIYKDNTKILFLNNPQNPTGNLYSNHELQNILEIVNKKNTILVTNETNSQIIYSGKFHSFSNSDSALEQTVIIEDLSYTFSMPGWGLAFCVGPTKLVEKLAFVLNDLFPPIPEFIQYAGARALAAFDDIIPKLLTTYTKCCENMVTGLNQVPGFKCKKPAAGIYAFPNISKTNKNGRELSDELLESVGVVVLPGELFGESSKDYIRISFATNKERINESIVRLQEMF